VTEIPEHLLRRSRERRAALSGGGGDAGGGEAAPSPATPAATEAAAAATPAPAAPAAPAAPPPPPPPPKPYVQAALNRRKIPIWAMPVLALLPLWAFFYAESLREPEVELTGPLAEGEGVYLSACSGCHGAAGGGGAGRQLNGGEVLLTFPGPDFFQAQLDFVHTGSAPYAGQPYGDPNRPGGPHLGLSYNGAAMPPQSVDNGGALTDEQILAAVCYVRVVIGGEDPPLPQCTGEESPEAGTDGATGTGTSAEVDATGEARGEDAGSTGGE